MRWRSWPVAALGAAFLLACGEYSSRSEGREVPSGGMAGSRVEGAGAGGVAMGGGGFGGAGMSGAGTGGAGAPNYPSCQESCPACLDFEERESADGTCNGVTCPAFPHPPDGRLRYRQHCCTDSGACGSGNGDYLGGACFERDQPGTPSDECPSGGLFLYVDLGSNATVVDQFPGCCRPDGQCGLDTSRSLGAGCVERSAMSAAAEDTCNSQGPIETFEPLPCTP